MSFKEALNADGDTFFMASVIDEIALEGMRQTVRKRFSWASLHCVKTFAQAIITVNDTTRSFRTPQHWVLPCARLQTLML